MALRSIELFAGAGGLALGLGAVGVRSVCYVEREAYAAAVLAARMAEGKLAPAPIWSDVTTFDGKPWRGRVDLIAGGFPCQDVSGAGLGKGIVSGERSGLWREFARIVHEVEPEWVFVENVATLVSRGLDIVLSDLAALRYDAEWCCVRASDVGAPHRRERIFILAYAGCGGGAEKRGKPSKKDEPPAQREGGRRASELGDAGSHVGWGCWPPGPGDAAGWAEYLRVHPGLEPALYRGADGLAARVDRLRALGNGVVPQQAAFAWNLLHERINEAPQASYSGDGLNRFSF